MVVFCPGCWPMPRYSDFLALRPLWGSTASSSTSWCIGIGCILVYLVLTKKSERNPGLLNPNSAWFGFGAQPSLLQWSGFWAETGNNTSHSAPLKLPAFVGTESHLPQQFPGPGQVIGHMVYLQPLRTPLGSAFATRSWNTSKNGRSLSFETHQPLEFHDRSNSSIL